jgi:lysophospholipase L1-like esterase
MRGFVLLIFQSIFLMASAQTDIVWWKLQSRQSAGHSMRFVSNAPEIIVRYKITASKTQNIFPATAANGVDLYAIDSDGLWHWAAPRIGIPDSGNYFFSQLRANDNFHKLGREYELFFPLHNSIEDLQIGVPQGTLFNVFPIRPEKPIVVFGSSIVKGEGASRPGLAWTNVLSRQLDRNVVKLVFSGNGILEKDLIEQVNQIDARIYVFDGLLDLASAPLDSIHLMQSVIEAIKVIRARHPQTPILCTEHAGYADGYLHPNRQSYADLSNRVLAAALNQLKGENINGLHLLTQKEINIQLDEMSDGSHPNDIGMMRYAAAYEKKLREIFMEPVGTLKTQIPIRQRRTPAGYDWEGRHKSMMALNKTESNKVLLIGNSITHNWGGKPNAKSNESWQKYLAPYEVRNFGFGADRIENVLWRIYHDELKDISPEKILINIGTNNLRVNSNEEILEGLRFLVRVIKSHQPKAEITLLGIYPRRDYEDRIVVVNKNMRKMAGSEHVGFADIGKELFLESGKVNEVFFNDGLHPNNKGYEVLGKQLQKLLKN